MNTWHHFIIIFGDQGNVTIIRDGENIELESIFTNPSNIPLPTTERGSNLLGKENWWGIKNINTLLL